MPVEFVVFAVGIVCVVLGGVGTWWCWAIPAIRAARDDTAEWLISLDPDDLATFRRHWELRAAGISKVRS